jgi:hypothetical protein
MSQSLPARFLIITWLATTFACVTGNTVSTPPARPARHDSAVLSEVEIERAGTGTAYDAIEHLRPQYLSLGRTAGTTGQRVVYLDGVRIGGIDALHGIRSANVREIRWLDSRAATQRFGTGHSVGAILILTKTGR